MQRKFRLTRSEDFKRVRRSGKSYAHPLVILIVQNSEQPRVRWASQQDELQALLLFGIEPSDFFEKPCGLSSQTSLQART